ncbi:MAG TPA: hypothetical protein ENN73_00800 [Firmicutes bacterium]|nr:hypothetical protein [Bacillota bacterium]
MKKIIFLLILSLVLFLFSCENPLKPTLEILTGDADYYPLSIGNYWRYSSQLNDDYSLKVKEMVWYGGRHSFRVEKREGNSYSSSFYSKVQDGVQIFSSNGWSYYVQYPFIKNGGWKYSYGDTTIVYTLEGWEDIQTPAGNFKDCAKFFVSEGRETMSGLDVISEYYYWFSKNVGIVKIEQTYSKVNQYELIQLLDYNIK